jgi:hypothetical protein
MPLQSCTDAFVSYAEETQTDKFTFAETLPTGSKVELHIKYVGELNDKMAGGFLDDMVRVDRWLTLC